MSENNYKYSKLSVEDYASVLIEFKNKMGVKEGGTEKQLRPITREMQILNNCLIYFPVLGADIESCKIIKGMGVDIEVDLPTILDNIKEQLKIRQSKYNLLNGQMPDLGDVVKKDGLEMIAELSLAVELKLSNDISVLEYISYHLAAKRKVANIKAKSKAK